MLDTWVPFYQTTYIHKTKTYTHIQVFTKFGSPFFKPPEILFSEKCLIFQVNSCIINIHFQQQLFSCTSNNPKNSFKEQSNMHCFESGIRVFQSWLSNFMDCFIGPWQLLFTENTSAAQGKRDNDDWQCRECLSTLH